MARICVLDTETTGTDPEAGAVVVEYAHLILDTETGRATGHWSQLCGLPPGETIPPEARAVHHIADEDLAGLHPVGTYLGRKDWGRVDAYCAHNARFDRAFLRGTYPFETSDGSPSRPWICTYQVARHLWPEAPSYGNQVLRYWLGVEPLWPWRRGETPAYAPEWTPHRALYDACTTAAVLLRQLERVGSAEELVRLTEAPVLLGACRFGRHRGTPWAEVPRDYLRWMMREGVQMDDPDVAHTVRHYLLES